METVYITQENAVLHRSAEHLILRRNGAKISTIPLTGVKSIVLMTGVQLTSSSIDLLLQKSIDVVFTSASGKIKGRLESAQGGGAITRLAQHSAFVNPEKRLAIAKAIVKAKVRNQMQLIYGFMRHDSSDMYRQLYGAIKEQIININNMQTHDEAMGIEGICARIYWNAFRTHLKEPYFERREYRPAPDIINSALNLGYSFLATEITTCLAAEKLDLEIGFLHSIHYGRNSLALDIMEPFRSSFIDAWLLKAFNLRSLTASHFKGHADGYFLNDHGFEKFCELYHENLSNGNWRRHFRSEAAKLKSSLVEDKPYEPFLLLKSGEPDDSDSI